MTATDEPEGFRRFTVAQYERMVRLGVLTENDRVERLEGRIVEKPESTPRESVLLDCQPARPAGRGVHRPDRAGR
ncbi:MAG TPA: hypothetical protein VH092_31700 [Urbifossiella sp.]|jgi:hypothetical protein|nr:hypothetical protein [Urbifossiella sp.]